MEHAEKGKHPVKNRKQAIAIGLSKARRSGVKVKPNPNESPSRKGGRGKGGSARKSSARSTTKKTTARRSPARKASARKAATPRKAPARRKVATARRDRRSSRSTR